PSAGDHITNVNQPHFTGITDAGETVRLFAQRTDEAAPVLVGQAVADANNVWSITTSALADGQYAITATTTDALGDTSTPRPILTTETVGPLVIDTVAPRVVDTSASLASTLSGRSG
ncbi:MAG: Ig-like domain-containing protein, partial [Singulisphaera sp.]